MSLAEQIGEPKRAGGAEPIHEYVIGLAHRIHAAPNPAVLDYGCGAGEVVGLALAAGMDAYGVDVFYGGGNARRLAEVKGLLGARVFELEDGVIPFPDGRFDVVVSNQVFEHIDDFTLPLREIHRVLKPGGVFVNLFPTRDVWREGHVGIPFLHRFPRDSRLRYAYALALRSLGAGQHKGRRGLREWTERYLAWIDDWTFYKPLDQVRAAFELYFSVADYGADYVLFRLGRHPQLGHLGSLLRHAIFAPFLRFACHALSGRVFVLRKR